MVHLRRCEAAYVEGIAKMKTVTITMLAVAGMAATANAEAFSTLKFDINQFDYTTSGMLSGSFTGTIDFSFNDSLTNLQPVEGNNTGPLGSFDAAGSGGTLESFSGQLTFSGGSVTGGTFSWGNDEGDSALTGVASAGSITQVPNGSFRVDGLLVDFFFTSSDQTFGEVDLSKFYIGAAGDLSNAARGDFAALRLSGANGGTADGEFVVTLVPMPTAVAMAGLGLAGVATRRRR